MDVCALVHQPGSSPNSILLGFFTKASSHGYQLHFQPFSPPWRMGVGAGKFQTSNHNLVFLGTGPHSGAIQEPTTLEQKTLLSPRKFGGIQKLFQEMETKYQNKRKMLLVLLSLRNLQGFQLCSSWGQRPTYVFSILSQWGTIYYIICFV